MGAGLLGHAGAVVQDIDRHAAVVAQGRDPDVALAGILLLDRLQRVAAQVAQHPIELVAVGVVQ